MIVIKSKTGLIAEIDELGAQLCRLSDGNNEYIYNNTDVWKRHSPVLFPFVGRHPNGEYQFQGKTYKMPIHGFVPTSMFNVVFQEENSVKLQLIQTEEIHNSYPFVFDFFATYSLNENILEETFEVINKGDTMYYGFGNHPGFNVPINNKLAFEDYYIEFPEGSAIKQRLFDENCLDSGIEVPFNKIVDNRLNLVHSLFDNDAILLTNTGHKAIIKTGKNSKQIKVEYPDTPYCALWHKVKQNVPFVCIEPWVSIPGCSGINEISKKQDFVKLNPGETKKHFLRIIID